MPKVVCIIQARTGSSRLPQKVLMDLMGRPLLARVIERLQKAAALDYILVATTNLERDHAVALLAENMGVGCFRGDEEDVLSRYAIAAAKANAEVVVRVTGDCPLIDPVTVDQAVNFFLTHDCDYVGAGVGSGFPRGLDTEVFSAHALSKAHELAGDAPSREHVTYFIYRHPGLFKVASLSAPPGLNYPALRLCVDEEDDYRLIHEIYRRLYQPGEIIDVRRVMDLLNNNPDLVSINAHVKQKVV